MSKLEALRPDGLEPGLAQDCDHIAPLIKEGEMRADGALIEMRNLDERAPRRGARTEQPDVAEADRHEGGLVPGIKVCEENDKSVKARVEPSGVELKLVDGRRLDQRYGDPRPAEARRRLQLPKRRT